MRFVFESNNYRLPKLIWLTPSLLAEYLLPKDEQNKGDEGHSEDAEGDEACLHALRTETHEQQHGEAKGDSGDSLQHKVVGGRSLKLGVDLAEEYHTVACGTREHAEHGEETLILIFGIEMFGTNLDINKGDQGTQGADKEQGHPDAAEVVEVDGGGARDNHKVEAGARDAVEGVVVDIAAYPTRS